MDVNNNSGFNLWSVREKEKLNGANFIDWYRNLSIILRNEKKEYVFGQPFPDDLHEGANAAARRAYEKYCNDSLEVRQSHACHNILWAAEALWECGCSHCDSGAMWDVWEPGEDWERYNVLESLFACKLTKGSPVNPHVIKMMGYIEILERLGSPLNAHRAIDVILQLLSPRYEQFIMNFQMNSMEKTLHGHAKNSGGKH